VFGFGSGGRWRSGHTGGELGVQVFLDEGCRTSSACAEIHVCVVRDIVGKGSIERACHKLCRGSFL
jgi:hypothetical protein